MQIKISIPSGDKAISQAKLGPSGALQLWHTQNILRHMLPYMPMETDMFATKQTTVSSATTITINAPQARYLYYGLRMVNSKTGKGPMYIKGVGYRWPKGATLMATATPLKYTTTFHPNAGPFWDKRMMADAADVIAQETTEAAKVL